MAITIQTSGIQPDPSYILQNITNISLIASMLGDIQNIATYAATTSGTNTFVGDQTITGDLTVTGTINGNEGESVTTGVTAFATGGQASAVLLTTEYTNVTVVATAGDSIKLPLATVAGMRYTVKNNGAASLDIFPNTSDTIDGGAANAAISMAPGTTRTFVSINTTDWESSQAIVVNGTVFTETTGITAFATGGQASAVALTTYNNNVTVCATAGDSVKLLTATAGTVQVVTNNGAAACDVFPNTSDTINGGAANAAISLPSGATMVFSASDSTDWVTNTQKVALSAGTVGLPALTFSAQPDMGLYKVSATQLGFSVSGALSAVVNTTGVATDVISEIVGGSGVTVDGVLLKDTTTTAFSAITKGVASTEGYGLMTLKSKSASVACAGGGTETIAVQVPAGAMIIGSQLRNDTTIVLGGGGVTYSADINAQSIGSGLLLTKNVKTNTMFDANGGTAIPAGAADITLTPNAGTMTSGTITAIVYYYELTSMTDAA